jgi:PAS domain S-box-containing protein
MWVQTDWRSLRFLRGGENVTDSVNLRDDFLLETPIPGVPLESILRTQELRERPSRSPDYETENRALVALANALADSPGTILQTLADRVLDLLHADSAGLSLLTRDEKRFYWAAIAGAWRPHAGSNVPRNSCPCGEVLDRNVPMLFTHWERRYLNFSRTMPVTEEGLFVPFYANGKPVGTIWAFAHDNRRKFDAEDLRLLERTSRFASAACQVLASIENLKLENAAREKAETAVRELANGLETQVRVRTQELERSTRELAEANEDLQFQVGLLQQIPVAAWTLRPDGTPDFVNRSWLEYSGQSLDYVQSNSEAWKTAIHPEDRETASKSICDGIRSGQDFTMEARFRRAQDGAYRWHLNRAAALRDAEGNLLRFVCTSTDIEDQKQSQENLRRAVETNRLIVDTALDAVITMDAEGAITDWNKQAEMVFGWSNKEAIGQHMSDLIIPERLRMAHERGLRHFLATGNGPILRRRIEVTAVRRNGLEFPAELEVSPMRLGQNWFFGAFIRDITDSKLAEKRLRESELNLRQMTETIPEMLWSATAEGTIDYCNARVLDYTGFSAEEIMGSGWTKLLHPDDVERTARTWRSCVATGAPYRVEIRTFHAADRTYRWCVTSALPLLDQQGRILKWYGTVVDMHDWRHAQEELRNTQAELARVARVMTMGELTSSIAHEVNQPLFGIMTNTDTCLLMLSTDPPDIDGARETTQRTMRDANRASDVIKRLRALYSKKDPSPELMDLNQATREVISLSLSDLQRWRVIVLQELADNLPLLMADRVQVQQVIMNLVRNASDAMSSVDDRPRELLIRTKREEGDRVQLSVKDAGVGFEPQAADRLFEAFYTTKNEGMGIGLSISRSIIEAHEGRLWAKANDGPGATFSFSIPCKAAGLVAEETRRSRPDDAMHAA